jgi:hypothetical protein
MKFYTEKELVRIWIFPKKGNKVKRKVSPYVWGRLKMFIEVSLEAIQRRVNQRIFPLY